MEDYGPTSAAKIARQNDLTWFKVYNHPYFRIRGPISFEFGNSLGDPTPNRPHVIVERMDGDQLRRTVIYMPWDSPPVENDDQAIQAALSQYGTS